MKLFVLTVTNYDSGRFERHDVAAVCSTLEAAKLKACQANRECFGYLYGDEQARELTWHGPSESDRRVVCWAQSSDDSDRVIWTVEEAELDSDD